MRSNGQAFKPDTGYRKEEGNARFLLNRHGMTLSLRNPVSEIRNRALLPGANSA